MPAARIVLLIMVVCVGCRHLSPEVRAHREGERIEPDAHEQAALDPAKAAQGAMRPSAMTGLLSSAMLQPHGRSNW